MEAQHVQPGDGFARIHRRYALIIPIPCFVDPAGAVWLDRAWHRDLLQHLSYLKDFVLCAPRLPRGSEPDLVRFDPPADSKVSFEFLPPQVPFMRGIRELPRTAARIWRTIGQADIVHSGISGWPYPLGWLANPMSVARGKKLVIVVESSWLWGRESSASWKLRLACMNPLREWAARWSCEHADLAIFTHPAYRDALRRRNRDRSFVAPAVWIREEDLISDEAARALWDRKVTGPARLLFAGRLVESKGIAVLLTALRHLDEAGFEIAVDVIGEGELRASCSSASAEFRRIRLSVLDPVPYGNHFFALLRRYHAVLVPSLSNEQPRIVFDANSQAVPVIASSTDGLRPHVEHGQTGWLLQPGDPRALASAIERAGGAQAELRSMGLAALSSCRGYTHTAMHRARSQWIARFCG